MKIKTKREEKNFKKKRKHKEQKRERKENRGTNDESWSGLNSSCSPGYCEKQTDVEASQYCCVIIAVIISSQG